MTQRRRGERLWLLSLEASLVLGLIHGLLGAVLHDVLRLLRAVLRERKTKTESRAQGSESQHANEQGAVALVGSIILQCCGDLNLF